MAVDSVPNPTAGSAGLFSWQPVTLTLKTPFRLSYGVTEQRTAWWLRLRDDLGWGEGTIPPYYGISTEAMEAYWQRNSQRTEPLPERIEDIRDWVDPDGPAPARAAVDLALHDYLSRRAGLPLYAALGYSKPPAKSSSFTIAVDEPKRMAAQAVQMAGFPILKIKLAGDALDLERLRAIRLARPSAVIRVDANAGWTFEQAQAYLPELERQEVELLEQPLKADEIAEMGRLQALTSIPIVADESVRTLQDVNALAQVGVRGVNIKLMKTGGLVPALEMIRLAKKQQMGVMLGCMIETAIGVTAVAHISSLADWLDLDAGLLVTNDPFAGAHLDQEGALHLPEGPGCGVKLVNKNFTC
jgi:L-alanine-DL-glutamate epimerase-like enolase superfamily enzyme